MRDIREKMKVGGPGPIPIESGLEHLSAISAMQFRVQQHPSGLHPAAAACCCVHHQTYRRSPPCALNFRLPFYFVFLSRHRCRCAPPGILCHIARFASFIIYSNTYKGLNSTVLQLAPTCLCCCCTSGRFDVMDALPFSSASI